MVVTKKPRPNKHQRKSMFGLDRCNENAWKHVALSIEMLQFLINNNTRS